MFKSSPFIIKIVTSLLRASIIDNTSSRYQDATLNFIQSDRIFVFWIILFNPLAELNFK